MKRVVYTLVLVLLVASVILSGCAKAGPALKTSPTPTAKPAAPAAAPAAAPTAKQVEIWTGAFGGSGYIGGAAVADVINKHSTWLKATPVEALGSVDKVKRMGVATLEEKKKAVMSSTDLAYWQGIKGVEPFDRKYDLRVLSNMMAQMAIFVANDPNIKTYQDLVGKRVNVGSIGGGEYDYARFYLRDCFGIWDKVKQSNLDFGQAKQALMDKRIDAYMTYITVVSMAGAGEFDPHSSLKEPLALGGELSFLSLTPEDLARGNKATGWSYGYTEVPAGALGPKQPNKVGGLAFRLSFYSAPELPDDVAYEWMRVNHEFYSELPAYAKFLKLLTPDTIGWLPVKSEAEIHPGALKYYKDKKLPIKMEK